MYVIIWEYHVKPEHIAAFEIAYGENGDWVELFRKSSGYLGTELLCAFRDPHQFMTIDRWVSSQAYNSFEANWQDEYQALDERCKDLTDSESFLGAFSSAPPGG